jgi:hypothetical protein
VVLRGGAAVAFYLLLGSVVGACLGSGAGIVTTSILGRLADDISWYALAGLVAGALRGASIRVVLGEDWVTIVNPLRVRRFQVREIRVLTQTSSGESLYRGLCVVGFRLAGGSDPIPCFALPIESWIFSARRSLPRLVEWAERHQVPNAIDR